jgi:hypothetical protein
MKRTLTTLLGITLLATAASGALFSPAVQNAGFEADAGNGTDINTDWFTSANAIVQQQVNASNTPTPDGSNWLLLRDDGWVYQQVGTVDATAVTYTVGLLLGDRSNKGFTGVTVELWGGGDPALAVDGTDEVDPQVDGVDLSAIGATLLDSQTFDPWLTEEASPAMTPVEASLNVDNATLAGEALWLRLSGTGVVDGDTQNLVDSVSVVPEPMTLSVLGLGGVALIKRRRR